MENDKKVIHVVMGHREDLCLGLDIRDNHAYRYICWKCGEPTLTETEYPETVYIVCNLCAYSASQELAAAHGATNFAYVPPEVKARIAQEAIRRNIPVELAIREFVKWKMGGAPQGAPAPKTAKKKAKR